MKIHQFSPDKNQSTRSKFRQIYDRYRMRVDLALTNGHAKESIIKELMDEWERVAKDARKGDLEFMIQKTNLQNLCRKALEEIIRELKGDEDVKLHDQH